MTETSNAEKGLQLIEREHKILSDRIHKLGQFPTDCTNELADFKRERLVLKDQIAKLGGKTKKSR